ncbi:hypothetical protein MYSTI_01811 [Myxococcus stipitatus DSM 14675]|uniref:Uncharacterized protein n=1 Tax=Myxococcus stipitatus (strain DSM 14675 / JCM 12634 / Mx s8) TaxID=1278073 RepID=L7U4Q5_MYXSD|nr:hypothetical protein [Myxococcus stipitatus]AGC43143.1 hypothetical protein MYSTI_01811 [Myxococcus stipitatus DSM 14675]
MGLGIPSFSDVKRKVTSTVNEVKDTVVDKAQDVKKAVVDTTKDVFEDVKHNPVTDTLKKAVTDPGDLARDALQGGLRVAYHGATSLLPDGAANKLVKAAEVGVDALAKTSELIAGKDSSLTQGLKTLGKVDLEGITRTTDPQTGQKLKGDWPKLWGTWLLEEKPKDLGTWDKTSDGTDRVTVSNNAYTDDLAGRPHQQQVTEEFFKMYPNPKPGDTFPPKGASKEVTDKALYVFAGPDTAENSKNKHTSLEWFIGSYRTEVKCTGIDEKTGKPNLSYEVVNNSHFESGTRVPATFQDKGLPPSLVDDRKREQGVGIGGDWIQRYTWTNNGVDNPNK